MDFSLFFFSGDGSSEEAGRYDLLLDSARFGDQYGFAAIWVPERHFVDFGGLYPNPSVLAAAIAVVTQRLEIRAGSVVVPLHHPIRIAEEWAVVDNLSGGRVAISAASGWHPDDFLLAPGDGAAAYPRRRDDMFDNLETVRRLWAGESFPVNRAGSATAVRTLPRPVRQSLPVWVSAQGSPATFARAGAIGANVLTGLVAQRPADLREKIGTYRRARAAAGHDPATGRVAAMIHTYLAEDDAAVRSAARTPLINYLRTFLLQQDGFDSQFAQLDDDDREAMLASAYERYHDRLALLGTPDRCEALVEDLADLGVDEIACLIDFGIEPRLVRRGLEHLVELKDRYVHAALTADRAGDPSEGSDPTRLQEGRA
jgi:natural product biosynthesis luciferase-like monooxygenase protein